MTKRSAESPAPRLLQGAKRTTVPLPGFDSSVLSLVQRERQVIALLQSVVGTLPNTLSKVGTRVSLLLTRKVTHGVPFLMSFGAGGLCRGGAGSRSGFISIPSVSRWGDRKMGLTQGGITGGGVRTMSRPFDPWRPRRHFLATRLLPLPRVLFFIFPFLFSGSFFTYKLPVSVSPTRVISFLPPTSVSRDSAENGRHPLR